MASKLPDVRALIETLISKPSVSCTDPHFDQSNTEVINLLAEWLEAIGFSICIQDIKPGKANLVATLSGPADSHHGLVLAGHTDTVPYDADRWTMDPLVGTCRNDRIYGLGSCDMKSFFAMAIAAIQRFDHKSLRHPLTIVATADEESSMSGAKQLLETRLRPGRFAVIGEPTGLKPIRMHKGVMMECIRVTGRSGHSSDPSLGANAIEGMQSVLNALTAWRSELQQNFRNPLFKVAVPTLNFGSIHGGDNPNRICPHCEMQIDIRPLPGMRLTELRDAMSEKLSEVMLAHPNLSLDVFPLFEGLPPYETNIDSPLVQTCESLTGKGAGAVAFGTEAPFFSQLGMDTVILGPGDIEQAHQADEYLELARIEPMTSILAGLIRRFCAAV